MKMEEGINSGMEINANAVAGTIVKYLGSCFSVTNSSTWIIDSGASEHMCFDSTFFKLLSSLTPPLTINLPNCQTILVTHIGTVSLFPDLVLENVLYVPSFKYNLMSVHKFCSQFSYTLFTLNHCVLQGLLMRRSQVFGKVSEGLYLLKPKVKESVFNSSKNKAILHSTVSTSSSVFLPSFSNPNCSSTTSNVKLWHIRLGHLPFSSMRNISFIFIPSNSDCFCDICPKAKQSRPPFPISNISTKSRFDLIHIDTWGPYKVVTHDNYKYFLTIVDDFS